MWPLPHRLRLQQIWLIVGRQAWGMAISGKSRVAITENANTKASYKQREDTKLWKNASSSKLADMGDNFKPRDDHGVRNAQKWLIGIIKI